MDYRNYSNDYSPEDADSMYGEFNATELYCPNCKMAVPVRQHLLLVLPEGDKYDYTCRYCGESIGSKLDRNVGGGILF